MFGGRLNSGLSERVGKAEAAVDVAVDKAGDSRYSAAGDGEHNDSGGRAERYTA